MLAHRTVIKLIVESVARQYELPPEQIFDRYASDSQAVREARRVCYWLANELRPRFHMSISELARCLDRHPSTALRIIRTTAHRRLLDPTLKDTTDRLLKDLQAV